MTYFLFMGKSTIFPTSYYLTENKFGHTALATRSPEWYKAEFEMFLGK